MIAGLPLLQKNIFHFQIDLRSGEAATVNVCESFLFPEENILFKIPLKSGPVANSKQLWRVEQRILAPTSSRSHQNKLFFFTVFYYFSGNWLPLVPLLTRIDFSLFLPLVPVLTRIFFTFFLLKRQCQRQFQKGSSFY